MPLLTSPIDGSPMRQIHRHGIEIDVCPATGGVWLDRGELEKLMNLLRAEVEEEAKSFAPPANRHAYKRDDDDYDDDDYRHGKYGYGHKKKSKMSKIMDIFDL
jgi:Zn-finger nucleic acid-binding protein